MHQTKQQLHSRPPLQLSDRQRHLLDRAVRACPPDRKDAFLADVCRHLAGPEVSDEALMASINAQMDRISHGHAIDGS